jgi:signal transduction histidine kinase
MLTAAVVRTGAKAIHLGVVPDDKQALGQMASGIAHDVNNALSPVIAYSELLQRNEPNLTANAKKLYKL